MEYLFSSILGIVQGLTEFIPVSSSAHLIITHTILGEGAAGLSSLAFDAVLQLATALALAVYFRKEIMGIFKKEQRYLLTALILGTIPAVVAGLFLENSMETIFRNVTLVAWALIGGSVLLAGAEYFSRKNSAQMPDVGSDKDLGANEVMKVTVKKGFLIGLFQILALIPGVSRSGATISGGLFLGLNRAAATQFSFFLALPILAGSGLKKLVGIISDGQLSSIGPELLIGSIAAFVVGLMAIHFLIKYVRTHSFTVFIIYRMALGIILLWLPM